jgi:hypothetical protein
MQIISYNFQPCGHKKYLRIETERLLEVPPGEARVALALQLHRPPLVLAAQRELRVGQLADDLFGSGAKTQPLSETTDQDA